MDWRDWVFALLGLWLIVAAFLNNFGKASNANLYNYLIVGVIAIVLALWDVFSGGSK